MTMLQRQKCDTPVKTFSARMPEAKYNALVDFALGKRLTLSAAVSYLIDNALKVENNESLKIV